MQPRIEREHHPMTCEPVTPQFLGQHSGVYGQVLIGPVDGVVTTTVRQETKRETWLLAGTSCKDFTQRGTWPANSRLQVDPPKLLDLEIK